jgi:hypothetical protein
VAIVSDVNYLNLLPAYLFGTLLGSASAALFVKFIAVKFTPIYNHPPHIRRTIKYVAP